MRRICAVLVAAALTACGAADSLPGPPGRLAGLLRLVPEEVVARGLFFGMGSALPLDGSLGFAADELDVVVESGSPPLTVASGSFDRQAVVDAAIGWGYDRSQAQGWTVLVHAEPVTSVPALVSSVPALAVRGRLLVLGTEDEVRSAVAGPQQPEWLLRAARALGADTTQAVLAPVVDVAPHSRRLGAEVGDLLDRHGARAPLDPYLGYALGRAEDGRGVLALVYPDGHGDPEQASALAQRLATTSTLGEPGRRLADAFEPGGPRWVADASVVRLPLQWTAFDAQRVRDEAERQVWLPLVPDPR